MFNIVNFPRYLWPIGLSNIPCPPKSLSIRGLDNFKKLAGGGYKFLTVVGSRKFTDYGEMACKNLISGLAGQKICIVSGLAYGIDCLAHQTAIENGLPTIAFPGSGLDDMVIYPQAHLELAHKILATDGSLISEFENSQNTRPWMFPQRNRLMVGIADAVLIIEAGEKSGSGISANMAVDYNRELLVVPGSVFNHNSQMCNRLIKEGANLIQTSRDILEILKIKNDFDLITDARSPDNLNLQVNNQHLNIIDKTILNFIQNGLNDKDEILREMKIPVSELNRALSKLEIMGLM